MSEVITEEQAQALNKARLLIAEGKEDAVSGFMKIGAGFNLVATHKLHRLSKQTFAQYIAETGMSWAKAHQAMSVHARFGHLDTKGVLHSRLIDLTSVRMDDEQKQEAVEKARVLGPRDFLRFVLEKKGREIPAECPHHKKITICEVCRARVSP